MNRWILVLVILITGSVIYGQSDSIERHLFYKKLSDKQISQDEFSRKWKEWNTRIKEIKNYPDLPVDKNGQVHYSFINEYSNQGKNLLFTRTLEWLAINYGLIPAYIYSSREDGKIIFRNNTNFSNGTTCNYTSILTIDSGKILTEFISIGYQKPVDEEYPGDIADRSVSFSISQVIPVIYKKPAEWDYYLELLRLTNSYFRGENENHRLYIMSYDSAYKF